MASKKEKRQKSDRLSAEAGFFSTRWKISRASLSRSPGKGSEWALLGRMYNQIGLWSWYVLHTPLAIPYLGSELPPHTHSPALLLVWSSFPTPDILLESSKYDGEKEGREKKERAREQKQNAFYVFKTFTKSRKCPLFICMFWSSFFIPPHWLFHMSIIQHFPCFLLFFFFFFYVCSTVCI